MNGWEWIWENFLVISQINTLVALIAFWCQLELKAQIDEQKKAKELQWKQKQLEDAEAERKMLEEQKIIQQLHETEIQLEKKKKVSI